VVLTALCSAEAVPAILRIHRVSGAVYKGDFAGRIIPTAVGMHEDIHRVPIGRRLRATAPLSRSPEESTDSASLELK
jgi:hypothetical protein